MINATVLLLIILIIRNIYSKLSGLVSWKGAFSNEFKILNGMKLEGILSAVSYNLYIKDLICSLRNSGYMVVKLVQNIVIINYADDIVLLSGSLAKIQFVLDICYIMDVNMISFLMVRNRNLNV